MITKNIKRVIQEYFFINPGEKLRVRQIERTLKIPLPSVIRYTKELEQEGLLKSQKISNIKVYTADKSSKEFIIQKRLFNIKQIFNSGLIEYLKEEYSNPCVVLFGSYSLGEDSEDSDIDFYIETSSKQNFNLKKYEDKLHRKIQVFNYKNLKQISNPKLANSIINGIVLNNYLEVFNE